MAVTDHIITPTVGPDFNRRTTEAEFALGTVVMGTKNTGWIYVQAAGTIAAAGTCSVNTGTFVATAGAGPFTADTAFTAGQYGWVRQTAQVLA
ncbi:MAG: hypothetical protein QNJ62_05165 [Methyloceanibacter sp.]|nr:hypothetical protein [Methyloceanibacter sp.]